MNKDKIERSDLKSNIMKRIIFRIDYQGVIDIEDILKSFETKFEKSFKTLERTFHNKLDFGINNIEDISETLSIPVKEIQKQEIYRFKESTLGQDNLTLDISKYFTTLTVDCSNYEGIDLYLDFFVKLIDLLYEEEDYLKIKRVGLRKIGGSIYFERDKIFEDFNKKYFNFDFQDTNFNSITNRYEDVLQHDDKSPVINYIRSFETGVMRDNSESKVAFQVILDIDGYYSENILNNINFGKGKAEELLKKTNHEHLFRIFKMSMTEDFLKKHMK